jgi:hypothetical protein
VPDLKEKSVLVHGDRAAGCIAGCKVRSTGIEEVGNFRIFLAALGDGFGTHQNITVSKYLFIRFLKTEGIGFMGHFCI